MISTRPTLSFRAIVGSGERNNQGIKSPMYDKTEKSLGDADGLSTASPCGRNNADSESPSPSSRSSQRRVWLLKSDSGSFDLMWLQEIILAVWRMSYDMVYHPRGRSSFGAFARISISCDGEQAGKEAALSASRWNQAQWVAGR